MIPKTLHYVWLGGGQKRDLMLRCIESWHRSLPGWDIIEWDESNFPVDRTREESKFFRLAYDNRLFEFIADYARLKVLYEHGGVYLDTDIELLRDLDPLRGENLFIGMQYPDGSHPWALEGAVLGSPKGHPFLQEAMDYYNDGYWSLKAAFAEITSQPMVLTHLIREKTREIRPTELEPEHITIYEQGLFHLTKEMEGARLIRSSIRVPPDAFAINHAFLKDTSTTKGNSSWLYNKKAKIFRRKVWYYRAIQPIIKIRKKATKMRSLSRARAQSAS